VMRAQRQRRESTEGRERRLHVEATESPVTLVH